MTRVSTNLTLFLKIFLPIAWMVFFGALSIALWTLGSDIRPEYPIGFTVFYVLGVILIYFTLIQLKRVEIGADGVYVTNYFKHFRYPFSNIEKMVVNDFVILKTVHVHFVQHGQFGKRIVFISNNLFMSTIAAHPELAALVVSNDKD